MFQPTPPGSTRPRYIYPSVFSQISHQEVYSNARDEFGGWIATRFRINWAEWKNEGALVDGDWSVASHLKGHFGKQIMIDARYLEIEEDCFRTASFEQEGTG